MSFGNKVDNGYLSFAKGLVTEYNPLAPPEGTTSDELNMDVDTDGFIRTRRPPLAAVSTEALSGRVGSIVFSSLWEDQDKILVIVKLDDPDPETGDILIDVLVYSSVAPLARELTLYFSVPANQYVPPAVTYLRKRAMLVLGGSPILLERGTESYNAYNINILIRDFKLIDDGMGTSDRPTLLDDNHKYNLLNSGWWQDRKLLSTGSVGDPVENFKTQRLRYPSNADISYLGDITDTDGDLKFKPETFDNIDLGSTEAPRGHYIYSISNINREEKLFFKTTDGSKLSSLAPFLEDGDDVETGAPPAPGGPIKRPPVTCDPSTGLCNPIP